MIRHAYGQVPGNPGDTEGLQADVMRFLAIIAFCLIAILALVEQKPAQPDPDTTESVRADEVVLATPETPIEPPPVFESAPALNIPETPIAERIPERQPAEQEDTNVEEPQVQLPTHEVTEKEAEKNTEKDTRAETTEQPIAPKALVLRFSSERDFIALISAGEISVFARGDGEFMALTRDFSLQSTSLQGDLFELMPGSLPDSILAIFNAQAIGAPYLVSLPTSTADRISLYSDEYLDQGGTLLIDRMGRVNYEKPD